MELDRALIGQSPKIRQILNRVEKLSKTRWPVLIQGETGTGKEVIARAIYGGCPDGPFIVVDCSALVGPLMESELFGYTKGAFTGAVAAKLGTLNRPKHSIRAIAVRVFFMACSIRFSVC